MMKTIYKSAVAPFAAFILVASLVASGVCADSPGQVIKVDAKKFEFSPNEITLKKGVPVTLEFNSLDRLHGFNCPDLAIRTDIAPKKTNRINLVPQNTGTFECHCDVFCGDGHGDMTAKIIVVE